MATSRRNLVVTLGSALLSLNVLCFGAAARAQEDCEGPPPRDSARADIAVSLKLTEAELARCQPAGTCTPQSLTWFGMTRVTGYAVNPPTGDIVLFGTAEPAAAPLRVDDFVVALRNALHRYDERRGNVLIYSDPAVSIDPDPAVLHRLEQIMAVHGSMAERDRLLETWCATCELPQTVRVMGVGAASARMNDSGSHFAQTMFSGDLLMKRISNGTASVAGLASLSDLAMQMAIARTKQPSAQTAVRAELNRFWFFPGKTAYLEDDSAVVLSRADVVLRTEAEQVTRNGHIAARDSVDPLADRFACTFSKLYPDLVAGTSYPVYAEMETLFRWVAIARIMVGGNAFDTAGYRPGFLLDGFVVPHAAVPRSVKGVAHIGKWDNVEIDGNTRTVTSLRLPSCGGVSISLEREDMIALPDAERQLPRLSTAVTTSRPARPIPWWVVRM